MLGTAQELENKIYRDMAGRLARVRQIKCTFFDAVYVFLVDFLELWLLGHSFSSLHSAWVRVPLQDIFFKAGCLSLSHMKRCGFKNKLAQQIFHVPGSASGPKAPTRFCICGCEDGVVKGNIELELYCKNCDGLLSPGCAFVIDRTCRPRSSSRPLVAVDTDIMNGKGSRSSGSNGNAGNRSNSSRGYQNDNDYNSRNRSPIRRNDGRRNISLNSIINEATSAYQDEQAKGFLLQIGAQMQAHQGLAGHGQNPLMPFVNQQMPWPYRLPQQLPAAGSGGFLQQPSMPVPPSGYPFPPQMPCMVPPQMPGMAPPMMQPPPLMQPPPGVAPMSGHYTPNSIGGATPNASQGDVSGAIMTLLEEASKRAVSEVDQARVTGLTDRLRSQGVTEGGQGEKGKGKEKEKARSDGTLDLDFEDNLERSSVIQSLRSSVSNLATKVENVAQAVSEAGAEQERRQGDIMHALKAIQGPPQGEKSSQPQRRAPMVAARPNPSGRVEALPTRSRSRSRDSVRSQESSATDPLSDPLCTTADARDYLDPSSADHEKIMVTEAMARHICESISKGLFAKTKEKIKFKKGPGDTSTAPWSELFPKMFVNRSRQHWTKYLKTLGLPDGAVSVGDKKDAGKFVLGALIRAGHIPAHPLVQAPCKKKDAVPKHTWPAEA